MSDSLACFKLLQIAANAWITPEDGTLVVISKFPWTTSPLSILDVQAFSLEASADFPYPEHSSIKIISLFRAVIPWDPAATLGCSSDDEVVIISFRREWSISDSTSRPTNLTSSYRNLLMVSSCTRALSFKFNGRFVDERSSSDNLCVRRDKE